ncbi:Undefined function [Listeria monocytogenes N53-1]|nr:Undefined function [Listeria monocytogenes N53-1]
MNGMAVLTEDSISHLGEMDHKLRKISGNITQDCIVQPALLLKVKI